MRKILLRNQQSPGDILMLTAAVRDLHKCHPGKFAIAVRSSIKALWEHSPHLTPVGDHHPHVKVIDCKYPLIHKSNSGSWHFIHASISS